MKKLRYGEIKSFAKGHKEILEFNSDPAKVHVLFLWAEVSPQKRYISLPRNENKIFHR
jgi:hypothetical protein